MVVWGEILMNILVGLALVFVTFAFAAKPSQAETNHCTEITSIPTTITVQGVYCFKSNLITASLSTPAITIANNNVTIDLNGWKLGGAAAGSATFGRGIYAENRSNTVVRNGTIRGFYEGVVLGGGRDSTSGNLVENLLVDGNRYRGITVGGSNTTIRNNTVINTGLTDQRFKAWGISAYSGIGVVIEDNTVSGINENESVFGIEVSNVEDAKIHLNNVFNLMSSAYKYGIVVTNSERVLIEGNTVSTGNGGMFGIGDQLGSTGVACIRNQVSGFTTNFSGCDVDVGNIEF